MSLAVNQLIGFGARRATSSATTYRYLQINITAANSDASYEITGLVFIAGGVDYPTSAMTSNTAPSPLVASASSDLGGSFLPFYAFNSSIATRGWISGTADGTDYLRIDLGAGNGIAPTSAKVAPSGVIGRSPKDFTFEGSNDATNWTVLNTQSGLTTGWTLNAYRTFTF